ncbi:MAG: tRNA (adenosine(37)-N6)-threonylcarbamoyltransferase complex dimerization subunit type 1 TsaB [Tissierellia bacterium]|nr:tRNA (adenosine(37)-N6)-threonylcarbamoyltransferase complex dimerization subunit type 1 TsaB [Tissierellia bacterium]
MILLSLLTGTASTGVSLGRDGESLISLSIEGGIRQSETVFSMVKDAFQYVDLTMDDVDGVAVLQGPGSFTGLRVGFAAAKAIAFAKDIPFLPIDTLDAIYAKTDVSADVLVLMDARKNRCYGKYFHKDGTWDEEGRVWEMDSLPEASGEVYVFGEGLLKYKDLLKEKNYLFTLEKDIFLDVSALEKAAFQLPKEKYQRAYEGDLNYLKTKEQVVCLK